MKKSKFFMFGILAAALIFGVMAGSCDTDDDTTFSLSIVVADGSSGMGSVSYTSGSPTGNAPGASVAVKAAPAEDHSFVKWSNNIAGMDSVSTDNPYTFPINANTYLCAVFAPNDNTTGIFTPDGTWDTDFGQGSLQITFASGGGNTWTITVDGGSYTDSGTYTYAGNYGIISSDKYSKEIGAYALTSATTMTMYLVAPNPVTGTYQGTKQP
jgi:hypothetical protein